MAKTAAVYNTLPGATVATPNASEPLAKQCTRSELTWVLWRGHVFRNNPGIDFFELVVDGRHEILSAYKCIEQTDLCPPTRLMVFHGVNNKMVLIAFVKQGCVTFAEDILVQEFQRLIRGTRSR